MTIRPDVPSRISRYSVALALGLAPLAGLALAAGSAGLLASTAHASPCPETRGFTFRAQRPPASISINPMPAFTITDAQLYIVGAGGVQCGPYDRISGFQLMRSTTTPLTRPLRPFRIVHEDAEGNRLEEGLSAWPDSDGSTDVFDGRDPRGLWQVAQLDPGPANTSPGEQRFQLSLALAEGAQPEPAVTEADEADPIVAGAGETDQEDEPDSGQAGAQASSVGAGGAPGTGSGGSGSAASTAEADDDPALTSDPGPSAPPSASDDGELAISDKPWIAEPEEAANDPGSKLLDALEQAGFSDHPQWQPLLPTILPDQDFGAEQADPEGYFVAPVTAPVGSRVPIRLTYDDRRHFDNLILVRADAPDGAVGRNVGRNTHLVRDEETVHRRAGDTPGTYEIRLRRHDNWDRRIMARRTIEITEIDIDLQVPQEVVAGEEFEAIMNPVMDGHLYVTTPDRDPENLINRNSQREFAIEDAEGPGLFTRRAPGSAGEYELRFNFNPSSRWAEDMGREGRMMASAPFRVVDAPPEEEAQAAQAEEAEQLEALEAQITALSDDLEEVTLAQTQELRDEIAALGIPALAMLIALMERDAVAPELAFAATAPVPPAQWGGAPVAPAPVAPVMPMGQPQPVQPAPAAGSVVAPAPAPAAETPGALSAQDERRVIVLITRLEGVRPEEQQPIIDELAIHGPAATEILLEMMQDGLVNRALALRAAAAIEADGEAPQPMPAQAPAQPATQPLAQPDAATAAEQATRPPEYRVTGVSADDMLNVRDRAGVPGSTVVGRLAPDARGVVRTGGVETIDGRDWWHVRHPALRADGGWVNSAFLAAQTGLAPEDMSYRVTGVAADDALNVRSFPGTDGAIIARIPPHMGGLRWNGESAAVAGGTWWELVHPDLPGGTGWVNARFLEAEEGGVGAAEPQIATAQAGFGEAQDHDARDADAVMNRLLDTLPQTSSIFPPGNELNPLTKAILVLENEEGVVPHARYRIRYALEGRGDGTGGPPVPYSFVEIERYNLGAVFRAELVQSLGEAQTAPPEHFGPGEHVAFRMEFRPIQGRVADLVAISRRVISDGQAQAERCLTGPCLDLASSGEGAMPWRAHEGHGTGFDRPYEDIRNGVHTPAAMADLLMLANGAARIHDGGLHWTGFEESESVRPGQPFLEIVMDVNLGQDSGVEAVSWYGHLMDDSVAAIWQRAISFPGGGAAPRLITERAFECARGEPGREGLCP